VFAALIGCIIIAGLGLLAILLSVPGAADLIAHLVITPLLVGLVVIAGIWTLVEREQNRRLALRRKFLDKHPDWADDPAAARLAAKWRCWSRPPGVTTVAEVIHAAPLPNPPRARIVCLGPMELPEVGELRFEPVIITPTRLLWNRLLVVPLAAAIFTLWLAQKLHLVPTFIRIPIGSFSYVLGMGVAAACVWVWRTTIRPTYLRLAPGMVQIVEFSLLRRRPTIRSYPMIPGTVAVAVRAGGVEPRQVWLARGEQLDQIPLWQMQQRKEATRRLWEALLSTAQTPPLSDEELLG